MAGSTIGNIFRVTTFGESHGAAIGAVIDGCPSGLELTEADLQPYLDRRRPGVQKGTSARQEADHVSILSGVFNGKTTGTPIALYLANEDQHSADYDLLSHVYRPGHADFCYDQKYGFRDWRGGGRSSGRETASRVAAGAVALKLLKTLDINVSAAGTMIGGKPWSEAEEVLSSAAKEHDSVGGIISCTVHGMPAGIGEPVFDKLEAALARAVLSIGACKGIEFGDGFNSAKLKGSEDNDAFRINGSSVVKKTNHAGGILGGISDGDDIIFRAAFKPTPTIAKTQETVTDNGENTELIAHGRHDTCIVPRAIVVVEAMTGLVLADALLENMSARMDRIERFYKPE